MEIKYTVNFKYHSGPRFTGSAYSRLSGTIASFTDHSQSCAVSCKSLLLVLSLQEQMTPPFSLLISQRKKERESERDRERVSSCYTFRISYFMPVAS